LPSRGNRRHHGAVRLIVLIAAAATARRDEVSRLFDLTRFGQSQRSRWEILLRGSVIDRFLGEVRDAAVQVVPWGIPDESR
jgi:hypothetical protein